MRCGGFWNGMGSTISIVEIPSFLFPLVFDMLVIDWLIDRSDECSVVDKKGCDSSVCWNRAGNPWTCTAACSPRAWAYSAPEFTTAWALPIFPPRTREPRRMSTLQARSPWRSHSYLQRVDITCRSLTRFGNLRKKCARRRFWKQSLLQIHARVASFKDFSMVSVVNRLFYDSISPIWNWTPHTHKYCIYFTCPKFSGWRGSPCRRVCCSSCLVSFLFLPSVSVFRWYMWMKKRFGPYYTVLVSASTVFS